MGVNPPLGGKREFLQNLLGTFRQDATLCQVSEKSDVRISRYRVTNERTDGRTDGRTHERESIGPSANAERPKMNSASSNYGAYFHSNFIFNMGARGAELSNICKKIFKL